MCFLLISKYCLKNVEVSDNVQYRYIYHFNRFFWPKPMSPSPIPFLCQNYGDQPGNKEIFEFFFTVLMSTASMRTVFYILSFLSLTTKTLVQLIQAGHTNLWKSCSYVFITETVVGGEYPRIFFSFFLHILMATLSLVI